MNTDKLLNMLLEAIDYSFLQTDGSYDKTLTYPVIDKLTYIKGQINDNKVKEVDLEKEMNEALMHLTDKDMRGWFRYFFELGLKVQKGE